MFGKKLKTVLMLSLAITAFGTFTGMPAQASYTLNPEVKDATPALKQAAEIGVRTYNNPAMQDAANKDAIVVMSFGTTFKDSRKATIEKTVADIQAAHPDTKVVLAFTSHIIVDRIKANEGLEIPTPEKAMADLKAQGYTRVALTSLDVIPGMEYAYDTAIYDMYKKDFKKMTMGTSLLYWMGQENQRDDVSEFVQALSTQFPKMGEGWPHLDTVIPMLKAKGIQHVTLMPMMMVAGDHANNDMAGADADSHKSILEKEGFKVTPYIHGLGENTAVRKMFVERANEAWDALEKDNGIPAKSHMMRH